MKNQSNYTRRLACLLAATVAFSQVPVSSMAAITNTEKKFSDVKKDAWYSEAINKWENSGIINGYEDGSFKPNKEITRAELAVIIDRIFDLQVVEGAKEYKDINEKAWYQKSVARVSALGLMNDYNESFNPNQPATREELAFALSAAYKLRGQSDKEFGDHDKIADWASNSVSALVEGGYMVGMPNGDFNPKAPLTRGALMVVVDRLNADIIKESGTINKDIQGNLVISAENMVLKDMTISGNLYLAGNVKNVTIENCRVNGILVNDTGNKCTMTLNAGSEVSLEGKFEEIHISKNVTVELGEELIIKKLNMNKDTSKDGKPSTIKMAKGAVIEELVGNEVVEITGKGEIKKVHENVAGIKSEVKPNQVITASGVQSTLNKVTATPENKPSSGGSSNSNSGGSSNSNSGGNSNNNSGSNKPGNDNEDGIDKTKWKLVWSDEFDGDKVDPNKWDFNTGFMDLNNEKQVYTRENATVSNGTLKITAKKEDTTIAGNTYNYTSSRMVTKGRHAQKYGKIEVRAKLPVGKSLWPAIWMLPENDEYTGWPTSGEIDIMESKGSIDNEVWGTLHYGDKRPNNKQSGSSYVFPEGEKINDFHTYGIEWQPGEIRWYIDGKLYQTQNNWHATDAQTGENYAFPAPFDKEFHIILNLALGGWYDGVGENLDVDDSIFANGEEYAMEVDYVRCYESATGEYPEAVDPDSIVPELPSDARKPLADGNLIYDNTFENGIQDNKEADKEFGEGWNLLYLNSYGGDAKASVDMVNGKPFAKITVDKGGNQNYAIQLVQYTTVGRGRTYKLSFDAKAEEARDISFKVGGGESRGYGLYSEDYTERLGTTVKHFEKTFTMKANTDTQARLEFNTGLDDRDVWIGNVKLEEIETPIVEENFNAPKTPLKNGSLIYNGAFDKGKLDRLTYWNLNSQSGASATMFVPEDERNLHIKVSQGGDDLSAVTLDQQGLRLSEDGNYTVQFTAYADKEQDMNVKLVGADGKTVYAEEKVVLTTQKQVYEFELQGQGNSTDKGRLVFEMGGQRNEIVLDDVSVVETRKDFSNVNVTPLSNGDFSQGQKGWEGIYCEGGEGNVTFNDEAKFTITDVGSNPWSVMLAQKDVEFAAGLKYIIEFDASSDIARDMTVKVEEEGTWVSYFEKAVKLNPETQRYTFEFTMPAESDKKLGLKFLMGNTASAAKEEHSVVIDNVVCEVKDGLILKSELQNGQFNRGLDQWNPYVADNAKATIEVVDKKLKMDIEELGQDTWEIQLSQKGIKLEEGKTYQVGFKAQSEEATSLKITVGHENEDYSYVNYLDKDYFFEIDKDNNVYKFTFTMNHDTDENAKFAIEAGKQAGAVTTTISLDDVYLTEVAANDIDEDNNDDNEAEQKGENLLLNGNFADGNKHWDGWAAEPAQAEFSYDEGARVNIANSGADTWHITLEQGNIQIEQGKTYCVAFDANVTTASSLRIALQDKDNNEYAGEYAPTIDLQEGLKRYNYEFTVDKEVNSEVTFKFQMGYDKWSSAYHPGENQIIINNVELCEKVEEIDETVVILDDLVLIEKGSSENLLKDADFTAHDAWNTGGAGVSFNFANSNLEATITNEGTNPWDVIVYQPGIKLEKGKTYELSFKGQASKTKNIKLLTANANYAEYFNQTFRLSKDEETYTYEFTVDLDTDDNLEFKIFMGAGI